MNRGAILPAGYGVSTILADMDFETYSEAGFYLDYSTRKWKSITTSGKPGLEQVGASVYTEHPSCELLSLAYDLKDGRGARLWKHGDPNPVELFEFIATGEPIEAWNSMFEFLVWQNVCVARMGWPPLPLEQLRDAMAKSRAFSLPAKLEKAAEVIGAEVQKDKEGTRLLNKFSKPRSATKNDYSLRNLPKDHPEDAAKLYSYNIDDIRAEAATSRLIPDLMPHELKLWKLDQKINARGVHIDAEGLAACIKIVKAAFERYNAELYAITGGRVDSANKLAELKKWLLEQGVETASLDADHVAALLDRDDLPPIARRAVEIRASLGAQSVKKLFAIDRRVSRDGRLRDLFAYYGADRTGRFAGRGPQPQNLPNSGPRVRRCEHGCGGLGGGSQVCPRCGHLGTVSAGWDVAAVDAFLADAAAGDLQSVEHIWGDAVAAVSGSLRGLFCAAPGHELISSDYSAIEAVVLAELAGEQWRIDVFKTHGKIYEMSAAKITGIPFEEFARHKAETGDHHPMRKKVGKVAELASGYQGGLGAWCQFGADQFMSETEIKANIKLWRSESPMIVKFWYAMEDCARFAIQNRGQEYRYRELTWVMQGDVLYCILPSGRRLCYHSPRLHPEKTPWGKEVLKITYMGYNSDHKKGPKGWMRLDTYGGKLTENVTQAVARDVLTHAMPALESAGYLTVLHIHDEVVCEVPNGFGTIDELEDIMADLPDWCKHWPIKAAGGWRGRRYRKD